ncbi:hypothetical protein [Dasania marina]|uniref:hypothetical protein n=1 Tax=Dasania marina TaxID=471499 RepID=UPI0030DBCB49|tara:strand:+ start:82399 stop:83196 length:798 start_codon:yes stop_codon:yes gene_type:complete
MPTQKPWWGDFSFAYQQRRYWSIGERQLVIERQSCEWNTWNIDTDTENQGAINYGEYSDHSPILLKDEKLGRHLQTATEENIRAMPALADRSIVTRPNVPLRLLGGEKTTIYVSTPLWFKAMTLPNESVLLDVPFWRPSDSWFGSTTREGEICYAKYTDARMQLELLEQRPHRAVTPVFIHNKQKNSLLIERLNVPVPLLSLYHHSERGLWTEKVNMSREDEGDKVTLVLEKQAPSEILGASLLVGPRIASERHTLIRSLGSLFA